MLYTLSNHDAMGEKEMNGAEALLTALAGSGIEVCFANPGTSEMHLVSAVGRTGRMRAILCLFEGVATGAADGYGRMADRPAATLLHVGCGFSNGMANLHNARKANCPVVNIVGDHATWHQAYDAPLATDVPAHARICSDWVRVSESADDLAVSGALAVKAALAGAGKIATLIVPANHAWEPARAPEEMPAACAPARISPAAVRETAALLSGGRRTALVLGGRALREAALDAAGRIAEATGADLLCETFPARLQRGAGRVPVKRIPYFAEKGAAFLKDFEQLILVGGKTPVAFFAYPGKPSLLAPENCTIHTLAGVHQDTAAALEDLAVALGTAGEPAGRQLRQAAPLPDGPLTPESIGLSLCRLLPEGAIIADEAITGSQPIYTATEGAAPHDWLAITGGSIGIGLPLALGASVACPGRKVVALQADGSALYTQQALWSMAREQADVTVVLLNNGSYAILNIELARVGAGKPNEKTLSMFDLGNPAVDWVALSRSLGVPAVRVETAEAFDRELGAALQIKGPRLIEAVVPVSLDRIFG